MIFKIIVYVLITASVGLWGYNLGTMSSLIVGAPQKSSHEVMCDDINGMFNTDTNKWDNVCEININNDGREFKIAQ